MRETILKSVSNPPKLFFAPFLLAALNIVAQLYIMVLCMIFVSGSVVLLFAISVCVGHVLLVIIGMREPHISSIIAAVYSVPRSTKNIIKEKGRKFVP